MAPLNTETKMQILLANTIAVKRYAIIKFYIHHPILAIRPHRPSPSPLLYAVYNCHDLRGKYPFWAVRFQIYFIFQDFLLVSMTGLHGAVPGVNNNTWADDCKKIKYTSLYNAKPILKIF